jgi:chromosomal replication initiation ATPase DnaA
LSKFNENVMSDKTEIENLLKNIQEGLKNYSVKELNEAIIDFINKKDDKTEEIDYVFQIVCDEYKTSPRILKKNNVRGVLHEAKQIIYCILHFNLGLSTRFIADRVFNNWHNSVHSGIKKYKLCDPAIKQDRIFLEKYSLLSAKFIETFTKEKIEE